MGEKSAGQSQESCLKIGPRVTNPYRCKVLGYSCQSYILVSQTTTLDGWMLTQLSKGEQRLRGFQSTIVWSFKRRYQTFQNHHRLGVFIRSLASPHGRLSNKASESVDVGMTTDTRLTPFITNTSLVFGLSDLYRNDPSVRMPLIISTRCITLVCRTFSTPLQARSFSFSFSRTIVTPSEAWLSSFIGSNTGVATAEGSMDKYCGRFLSVIREIPAMQMIENQLTCGEDV